MSQREGNTSPRSRKWCFTFHNYTDNDVTNVTKSFQTNGWKYIFSKELGSEGKTPHLQGYLEGKNAIRFETLKKLLPTCHLEVARGTQQDNVKYITKEHGEYFTNIETPYQEELEDIITNLYPWQQQVVDTLNKKPEKRKIYWIHDPTGNKGKTELCRYLFRQKLICWIRTAKTNDIKYILSEFKNCRDIIFDLPRNHGRFIDYGLLEELKDGLLFSGKYEGLVREIAIPHIFIMSNELPQPNKLTEDKLVIINI
nr:MAG: replication associated protein [Virus sp.]